MNPERLKELLHSLPREEASERFTQEIMRRTRSVRSVSGSSGRMFLVWAATVIIFISGVAGQQIMKHRDQARLESLRAEQRQLEQELTELKRLSEDYSSVLRVDGNDGVQYVVDLDQFSREQLSNEQTSRVSAQIQ